MVCWSSEAFQAPHTASPTAQKDSPPSLDSVPALFVSYTVAGELTRCHGQERVGRWHPPIRSESSSLVPLSEFRPTHHCRIDRVLLIRRLLVDARDARSRAAPFSDQQTRQEKRTRTTTRTLYHSCIISSFWSVSRLGYSFCDQDKEQKEELERDTLLTLS
jgi:hypothetical protein